MGFSLLAGLAVDLGATAGGFAATAAGVAGSAALGAGLGAGLGEIEGGNPLTGAIEGGITGGFGGIGGAIGPELGIGTLGGTVLGATAGGALGHGIEGGNPLTGALEGGAAAGAGSLAGSALGGGSGPGAAGGGGSVAAAPIGGAADVPVDLTNLSATGGGATTGGFDASGGSVPSVFNQPNVGGIGTPNLTPQFNIGAPDSPVVGGTGLALDQIAGAYGSNTPAIAAGPQGSQGQFGSPGGGGLFGNGGILGTGIGAATPTATDALDPNSPLQSLNSNADGAGGASGTGGGGTSGASNSGLFGQPGSFLSKLTQPSTLLGGAVAGGGLLYNLISGGTATQGLSALQNEANTLQGQSSQLTSYLQSGNLPPGLQETVNNASAAAKAQVRGYYASIGQSGGTAENTALSQVDSNTASQIGNIGESLLTTGINEAQITGQLLQGIIGINQKQSAATASSIASLAAALSGGGGIRLQVPGTSAA